MSPADPRAPGLICFLYTFIFFFSHLSFFPGRRVFFCLCLDVPAEGDATSPKLSSSPKAFKHALTFILTLTLILALTQGWGPCAAWSPWPGSAGTRTPALPGEHGHRGVSKSSFIAHNKSKARGLIYGKLLTRDEWTQTVT